MKPLLPTRLLRLVVACALTAVPNCLAQTFTDFKAAGANAAAIQPTVDAFRAGIGGANNGVGGTFATGRREINWDGVPDNLSEPNNLPADFFNVNSPRGVVFSNFKHLNGSLSLTTRFSVSADSSNPTASPVRFANVNAQYSTIFQTFSGERLFRTSVSTLMDVRFFVPGTQIPATVSAFGLVFCDVDNTVSSSIEVYGPDGAVLRVVEATPDDDGLSFVGTRVTNGAIARVVIRNGNHVMTSVNTDNDGASATADIVAMDDFIYGEPQPLLVNLPGGGRIEATVPMSFQDVNLPMPPLGFQKVRLRCSPHHTYRVFTSTDLINWTPAAISGNIIGPDANKLDPRTANAPWFAANLASEFSVQKDGPNRFYRVVDDTNSDLALSPLVP